MDNPKAYWVGFNLVKGIGPARLRWLLDAFGDIGAAWQASQLELEEAGLGARLAASVVETRNSDALERAWRSIEAHVIKVITWEDEAYPRRLKEIDQSPPVLYLRGDLAEADFWAVAMVGTRRITAYGRQTAQDLASALAQNGVTIISGMARGVDQVSHLAALNAGGRTLAVLGSGVDVIYPSEHRSLAERIISQGALVSDYPPGTQPEGGNFPPRNRIISGLSQAVVVVEAGDQSGALITAAFAAEQGREVFAVPGQIYAPQSKGANRLIREGAHILLDVQDILEVLNMAQVKEHTSARLVLPSDATEAQLYALLDDNPLHIDELRLKADLPIEKVTSTLILMELKGLVRQVGNMRYVAVMEPREAYQP